MFFFSFLVYPRPRPLVDETLKLKHKEKNHISELGSPPTQKIIELLWKAQVQFDKYFQILTAFRGMIGKHLQEPFLSDRAILLVLANEL